MTAGTSIKTEFFRNARNVVPPVLAMSVLIGLFNVSEWSLAGVLPKVGLSFVMGLMMCAFGLVALYAGLSVAHRTDSQINGWLTGLVIGFAGIAFMLWYFAQPAN
jgi:hypothetical protein